MPGEFPTQIKEFSSDDFSQITTGKLGIDLERTMVIHDEKNPNIWKTEVTLLIMIIIMMMVI